MRRITVALAIAVVAVLSGSAAWTAIGRWRTARAASPVAAAPPVVALAPEQVVAPAPSPTAPAPTAPASTATTTPPVASPSSAKVSLDEEARAYGRAHAAHFEGSDARRALALWEAYLARYPKGTFAPEARFNRALCLLRLGRRDEARAALEPFAAGAYGRYRKHEAESLLDWTEAPAVR